MDPWISTTDRPKIRTPQEQRRLEAGPKKARTARKEHWMKSLVSVFVLGVLMFTAVFIGRYGSLDPCNMVRQEMLIQGRMHGGRTGEVAARSLAQETFDPYVQAGIISRTHCAKELVGIWTSGMKVQKQFAEGSGAKPSSVDTPLASNQTVKPALKY